MLLSAKQAKTLPQVCPAVLPMFLMKKETFTQSSTKKWFSSLEVTEKYDIIELKTLIEEHVATTGSQRGKKILDNFDEYLPKFKKIIPHDYKRMMVAIAAYEEKGLTNEQAQIEAFYEIVNNK